MVDNKDVNMKKIVLLFITACVVTSRTSVKRVTSFHEYNRCIQRVQNDLAVKGYELSGHKEETSSNAVVTAVSYSTQSGYGTAMDNDVFTYDTYTFSNNTGDIVEIELKYRDYYSKYSDVNYIQTVELLGCKTSKAADYNDVCGNNSMTKYLLQNINRDIDVEVYNHNKTMSLYSILLLGLSFSPLLLLL